MMQAINSTILRLAWVPMLVVVIAGAALVYWATDKAPPVIYRGNPVVEVLDSDVIRLQFDVERVRACDSRWSRWISDQDGFKWYLEDREASSEMIRALELDTPGRVRLVLPLPRGARRGQMAYNLRMRYTCDPLGLFTIPVTYSVPFYVDPVEVR